MEEFDGGACEEEEYLQSLLRPPLRASKFLHGSITYPNWDAI
jgi:hypothetical protein